MQTIYDHSDFDAAKYDQWLDIPKEPRKKIGEKLIKLADIDSDDTGRPNETTTVLSVGSGTGRLDLPFLDAAQRVNSSPLRLVAVEPSVKMCDRFEKRLKAADFHQLPTLTEWKRRNVTVNLIRAAFPSTELNRIEGCKFSTILALFVIHTVPSWTFFLRALLSHLKEGGRLILAEERGDVQWLDGNFCGTRISNLYDPKHPDARASDAEQRRLHYHFWQKYHRTRRETLGKGWYPAVSASSLGPVHDVLGRLADRDIIKRIQRADVVDVTWSAKHEFTYGNLLEWVGPPTADDAARPPMVFTPLSLWGLTGEDLRTLRSKMDDDDLQRDTRVPRREAHRFLSVQLQRSIADDTSLDTIVTPDSLSVVEDAIRYSTVHLSEHIAGAREHDVIHRRASDRLLFFYQRLLRGQEPLVLAYISWDFVRSKWRTPLPLLVAGIPRHQLSSFLASYASYSWFQARHRGSSLNETLLRSLPESFVFRVTSEQEADVDISSERSGRPTQATVVVPTPQFPACCLSTVHQALTVNKDDDLSEACPEVGDVVLLDYDQHIRVREEGEKNNPSLESAFVAMARAVKDSSAALRPKLEAKLCAQNKIRRWWEKSESTRRTNTLVDELTNTLPAVFLIGAGTESPLERISWIPGKALRQKDRDQAFGGLLLLELRARPNETARRAGTADSSLVTAQAVEGALDAIRETSLAVRRQAMRSAVSAILARVMAHDVGSHMLQYMEFDDLNDNGFENFRGYLRERMVFLAHAATSNPLWGHAMDVQREIVVPFRETEDGEATVMCKRIAESEGVTEVAIETHLEEGVRAAIPGGSLGRHALYCIFENVIRNGAKYGEDTTSGKLTVHFKLDDGEEAGAGESEGEFFRATVWDDRSTYCDDRWGRIRQWFPSAGPNGEERSPWQLVSRSGTVIPTGLGMKEMRIAAAWLRGRDLVKQLADEEQASEGSTGQRLLWPREVTWGKDREGKDRKFVGYEFRVARPRDLAFVSGKNRQVGRGRQLDPVGLRRKGVLVRRLSAGIVEELEQSVEDLGRYGTLLVELPDNVAQAKEWARVLKEQRGQLPVRMVVAGRCGEVDDCTIASVDGGVLNGVIGHLEKDEIIEATVRVRAEWGRTCLGGSGAAGTDSGVTVGCSLLFRGPEPEPEGSKAVAEDVVGLWKKVREKMVELTGEGWRLTVDEVGQCSDMILDNHGRSAGCDYERYERFDSRSGTGVAILGIRSKAEGLELGMSLLEAAAMRVAIADERISKLVKGIAVAEDRLRKQSVFVYDAPFSVEGFVDFAKGKGANAMVVHRGLIEKAVREGDLSEVIERFAGKYLTSVVSDRGAAEVKKVGCSARFIPFANVAESFRGGLDTFGGSLFKARLLL